MVSHQPGAAADTAAAVAVKRARNSRKPKSSSGKVSNTAPVLDADGDDISAFMLADQDDRPDGKRSSITAGCSSDDEEDTQPSWIDQGIPIQPKTPQIIFCSRTHSQLSQFIGELHRTRFADTVSVVALGSRKSLCVNDQVLKLRDISQINERCMELQRTKRSKTAAINNPDSTVGTSKDMASAAATLAKPARKKAACKAGGCPYLQGGLASSISFKDAVLVQPVDVEELSRMGKAKKVCPYYAARMAVPEADVVLAPYNSVLQTEARDSLGINLAGSVVIFDEAHNLQDAINGAHSASITGWHLVSAQRQITAYLQRFKSYLNAHNAQQLQVLLRIASALQGCLSCQQTQEVQTHAVMGQQLCKGTLNDGIEFLPKMSLVLAAHFMWGDVVLCVLYAVHGMSACTCHKQKKAAC
eukprot:jgi/Chrzof1/794/Cz01g29030.t1